MKKSKWRSFTDNPASIFGAATYRDILYARLAEHQGERGYQKRLAEAAGCRPSYLSQVLNSHIQLTPDQAAGIAEFWGLSEDETEYFLGLVGSERSSSPALRRHLARRAAQLRQKHMRLSGRVAGASVSSPLDQAQYYANWFAPAIHVLLGIKTLRTVPALSARLRLPEALVAQTIQRLVDMGLVLATTSGFQPSEKSLHLGDDSPFISSYHGNWRQQAMLRQQEHTPGELHFTGLYALGEKDKAEIRELLMQVITRSRAIAVAAPEETTAVCMLCDFFAI